MHQVQVFLYLYQEYSCIDDLICIKSESIKFFFHLVSVRSSILKVRNKIPKFTCWIRSKLKIKMTEWHWVTFFRCCNFQILFNSSILQITAWLDTDTWHIVESWACQYGSFWPHHFFLALHWIYAYALNLEKWTFNSLTFSLNSSNLFLNTF